VHRPPSPLFLDDYFALSEQRQKLSSGRISWQLNRAVERAKTALENYYGFVVSRDRDLNVEKSVRNSSETTLRRSLPNTRLAYHYKIHLTPGHPASRGSSLYGPFLPIRRSKRSFESGGDGHYRALRTGVFLGRGNASFDHIASDISQPRNWGTSLKFMRLPRDVRHA